MEYFDSTLNRNANSIACNTIFIKFSWLPFKIMYTFFIFITTPTCLWTAGSEFSSVQVRLILFSFKDKRSISFVQMPLAWALNIDLKQFFLQDVFRQSHTIKYMLSTINPYMVYVTYIFEFIKLFPFTRFGRVRQAFTGKNQPTNFILLRPFYDNLCMNRFMKISSLNIYRFWKKRGRTLC